MSEIAWITGPLNGYTKLNPTGRWKFVRGGNGYIYLMVEHKGRFFKSWVVEFDIEFMPADYGTVFDCGKGN